MIGSNDLRVAYSLNSQGLFCQAGGDYADAQELYEEAVRGWRRGSHLPAARTAYSEFCDILRQTQWDPLAAQLEALWDQPVSRSAFNSALLPLDSLTKSGMKVLVEPVEEEADDGVLRLPSLPAKQLAPVKRMSWWLAGLLLLAIAGALAAGFWWMKNQAPLPQASPAPVKRS